MTISDPQPGFQGHCILISRISQKRSISGTKLLKNTTRKPYTVYRIVQLSMTCVTSDPDFKVAILFDIEYLKRHEIEP